MIISFSFVPYSVNTTNSVLICSEFITFVNYFWFIFQHTTRNHSFICGHSDPVHSFQFLVFDGARNTVVLNDVIVCIVHTNDTWL